MKNTNDHITVSMPSEEKLKLLEIVENRDETISRFTRQAIRQRIQSLRNKESFEDSEYNFGL